MVKVTVMQIVNEFLNLHVEMEILIVEKIVMIEKMVLVLMVVMINVSILIVGIVLSRNQMESEK